MKTPIVITKKQADEIICSKNSSLKVSLDLGASLSEVIKEGRFVNICGARILIDELKRIKEEECYIIVKGKLQKLAFFSGKTNFYYKLVPTKDWPTFTLSSTPMHRHTNISPKRNAEIVIRQIKPHGIVLDTCCGLGYSAILSSQTAEKVFTFELDKNVIELAKFNPYSSGIFTNKNIKLENKSIADGIKDFAGSFFDVIIHDPPTFKYSPLLYSENYYRELYRELKKGGIIYHYAPCPQKMKGNVFYKGIIKRMIRCGFTNVYYDERISGVVARKLQ